MLDELAQARADGTYLSALRRLAKTQVLVIDDFGLDVLGPSERRLFLPGMPGRSGPPGNTNAQKSGLYRLKAAVRELAHVSLSGQ